MFHHRSGNEKWNSPTLDTNGWGWRCCRAITAAAAVTAGASRRPVVGRNVARAANADRCTRRREPVLFSAAQPDPLLSLPPLRFRASACWRRLPGPDAQQVVRSGRCADHVVDLFPLTAGRSVVAGAQGWRGGGEPPPAHPLLIIAFCGASWAMPGASSAPLPRAAGLSVRPAVCRSN